MYNVIEDENSLFLFFLPHQGCCIPLAILITGHCLVGTRVNCFSYAFRLVFFCFSSPFLVRFFFPLCTMMWSWPELLYFSLNQKFSGRFSFSFAKIMLVFCILVLFGQNLWKWEEQAQAILLLCEAQVWLWFSMMVFAHQWANSVSICRWYNCIVKGIVATIREEIHGKEMLVIALIVCLVFFA